MYHRRCDSLGGRDIHLLNHEVNKMVLRPRLSRLPCRIGTCKDVINYVADQNVYVKNMIGRAPETTFKSFNTGLAAVERNVLLP